MQLYRGKNDENPLSFYEENRNALEELKEEISRQIKNEESQHILRIVSNEKYNYNISRNQSKLSKRSAKKKRDMDLAVSGEGDDNEERNLRYIR